MPYWILPPYNKAKLVRRQITDPALIVAIRKWQEMRQRAIWEAIRAGRAGASADVCEHLCSNLQQVRLAETIRDEALRPSDQVCVEKIIAAEWWFIPDRYGRIHTNLTNLRKDVRQHLRIDGKRLVNVDIGESQPLFFGIAVATKYAKRDRTSDSPATQRRDAPQQDGGTANRREAADDATRRTLHMMDENSIMMDSDSLLGVSIGRDSLPDDLRRYLEACENRELYNSVAKCLGKTREQAKKRVMVALFDKVRPKAHRSGATLALEELFPDVMAEIRRIKTPNYRRMAHFAQREESRFMFGRVVPRIMFEQPDLFIATIHDSILTTEGSEDYVQEVMLEEFKRLGIKPQVNIETT